MLYKRELSSDPGRALPLPLHVHSLKANEPVASWDSNVAEDLDGIQCPFTDVTTNVSAQ